MSDVYGSRMVEVDRGLAIGTVRMRFGSSESVEVTTVYSRSGARSKVREAIASCGADGQEIGARSPTLLGLSVKERRRVKFK